MGIQRRPATRRISGLTSRATARTAFWARGPSLSPLAGVLIGVPPGVEMRLAPTRPSRRIGLVAPRDASHEDHEKAPASNYSLLLIIWLPDNQRENFSTLPSAAWMSLRSISTRLSPSRLLSAAKNSSAAPSKTRAARFWTTLPFGVRFSA